MNDSRRERVIDPLLRYARLPTHRLVQLYGSAHVQHILKTLYHEAADLPRHKQILDRPDEINRHVGTYLFHELAEGAYAYTDHTENFIRRTKIGKARRSAHDTHICMIVADIEATLREQFVSHLDILNHENCPAATRDKECPVSFPVEKSFIEPDALFGHEIDPKLGKNGYKFYAVELDRGTESLTVIDQKIAHWNYVLDKKSYETELGIPNLRIMWLAYSPKRLAHILSRVPAHQDAHVGNVVPKYHLFDNAPPVDLSLFRSEWRTARGFTRLTEK